MTYYVDIGNGFSSFETLAETHDMIRSNIESANTFKKRFGWYPHYFHLMEIRKGRSNLHYSNDAQIDKLLKNTTLFKNSMQMQKMVGRN